MNYANRLLLGVMPFLLSGGLCGADGAAAIDPKPVLAPLAPILTNVDAVPTSERLQRDLERAARERDERIQEILRTSSGIRPIAAADLGPGLVQPRTERERALIDLRTALDEYLGRTHRKDSDVLDASGAVRQAQQLAPMSAANHLSIAECLQSLCGEESGAERERRLNEGVLEIAAIGAEMSEELRPRVGYLKVWFLAELARMPGEASSRAEHITRAKAAANEFIAGFPSSELIPAVTSMVKDLQSGSKP